MVSSLSNETRISCKRERRNAENLCNEKAKLEALVIEVKSNNEEYVKIKQTAEEKVKDVLSNYKILLRLATASVIESLRRNPGLCNFVLNDISNNNDTDTNSYGSNCLPLISSEQQKPFSYLNDDICTAVILEEAEKLYNELTTKLTNSVIAAAAAVRASLSLPDNDKQKLIHKIDSTYQAEESRYNQNRNL